MSAQCAKGFDGKEVDMHAEMFRITGRVIFRLIFGHDLDYSEFGGLDNIKKLFLSMIHFLVLLISFPVLRYMPFLPISKKAFAAKAVLMRMTRKAISEAISNMENGKDGDALIYEILRRGSGTFLGPFYNKENGTSTNLLKK